MHNQKTILIAGKPKIYATDGSGRDTYVNNNSGGFTANYNPAPSPHGG